jgi:hypothetical protein
MQQQKSRFAQSTTMVEKTRLHDAQQVPVEIPSA